MQSTYFLLPSKFYCRNFTLCANHSVFISLYWTQKCALKFGSVINNLLFVTHCCTSVAYQIKNYFIRDKKSKKNMIRDLCIRRYLRYSHWIFISSYIKHHATVHITRERDSSRREKKKNNKKLPRICYICCTVHAWFDSWRDAS